MSAAPPPPSGPAPVTDAAALDGAREYAALSGPFDPVQALRHGGAATDAASLTAVAAGLSQDCDKVMPADGAGGWLMRGANRRRVLDRLAAASALEDAVSRRRADLDDGDEATRDLLDALEGRGIFTQGSIDAAIEAADRPMLERMAVGLGRADGYGPMRGELPRVKSALTRLELLGSTHAATGGHGPEHEAELGRIIEWLDSGLGGGPALTLYIEGAGGVGKSALLEEVATRLLVRDDDWVVVRLDFDRAGLDVQDTVGLTMEFARQVATQLPGAEADIQRARQRASGTTPGRSPLKGDSPERVPEELGLVLQHALTHPQRRVLLVLDDLELLRERGATHPARLFEWVDELVDVTHAPIAVVGAGRGDALGSVHARIGERIELPGLDDAVAERELERLGVDATARETIRAIAGGDPLTLRLAARVANDLGPDALIRAAGRGAMTATYLYRVLVAHLADPDLRRIAGAALVVRRLDREAVRAVVGPRSGLRALSAERAAELFDGLAGLDWMMEPDPIAPGFIRPRPDLRAVVLPHLYESAPARSTALDRAAARWFGLRPEPWADAEAAYHRLQLMRRQPGLPPDIPAETLARIDVEAIAELPPEAQQLVRRSRGAGTVTGRVDTRSAAPSGPTPSPSGGEPSADDVRELRAANDRSDWLEGAHVYARAFAGATLEPGTLAADTALTFLWRSGRWTDVAHLVERLGGWRPGRPIAERLSTARLDTICRLEIGAETDFEAMVDALRTDSALAERAASLAAEPMLSSLLGAGLRFALHRVGITVPDRRTGGDPAAAAIRRWAPDEREPASRSARSAVAASSPVLPAGWARIVECTGAERPDDVDPAVAMARSAAVLTPFADLVDTMSRLPAHAYLGAHAAAARPRLDALGFLAPSGSSPWHDLVPTAPGLAVRGLTDLGLLAEFAGAAAHLRRDRDLRLVATAAERWRRAVAGSWSYGTRARPAGWDRALDVTLADRLAAIVAASDPVALAHAHLEAWAPELANGAEVLRLIRDRSPSMIAAAAEAAASRGPGAAATVLLRRGLPSAFVPAVAVLVAHESSGGADGPGRRPRPRPTPTPTPRPKGTGS